MVHDIDLGPDRKFRTGDDIVRSFSTTGHGDIDPEGLTAGGGKLFLTSGLGKKVYVLDPGPNGVFEGVGTGLDDTVSSWDTLSIGQGDPEDIDYKDGLLYIVSNSPGSNVSITDINGTADGNSDPHGESDENPDQYAHGDTYTHGESDENCLSDAYRDGNQNGDRHQDFDTNKDANQHCNIDEYTHQHANPNRYSYADDDPNIYAAKHDDHRPAPGPRQLTGCASVRPMSTR